MTISYGPKLGLLVDGAQGEEHYAPLMKLLRGIDALVQCDVIDYELDAPPVSPADGDCYLVSATGGTATGAWAGHENDIARYSTVETAWEFYTPRDGWIAWAATVQMHVKYTTSGGWEGLVSPLPAPPDPGVFVVVQGSVSLASFDSSVAVSDTSGVFYTSGIARATPKSTGKRYFELSSESILDTNQDIVFGFSELAVFSGYNQVAHSIAAYTGPSGILVSDGLFKANGATITDPLATITDTDVIGFALDLDAGLFWVTQNGTPLYGNPTAGTGGESYGATGVAMYPFCAFFNSDLDAKINILGASVAYLPSGFIAWGS